MWLETFVVFAVMCWALTWALLKGEPLRQAVLPRRRDRGVR
jgi:hypothetical protein